MEVVIIGGKLVEIIEIGIEVGKKGSRVKTKGVIPALESN